MTRKDYVLIATALNRARDHGSFNYEEKSQHEFDCHYVADALSQDNPRFDRARFLKACGVE
jgi:hypothetical protein